MVRVKFIGIDGGLDPLRSISVGGERALVPLGEIARPTQAPHQVEHRVCHQTHHATCYQMRIELDLVRRLPLMENSLASPSILSFCFHPSIVQCHRTC